MYMLFSAIFKFAALVFLAFAGLSAQASASEPAIPTWVKNLPLWQWYAIPNTQLAATSPQPRPLGITGPVSKIIAWNGATLKRQGSVYLLGAAGGHADYAGNEVNALALNTAMPHWVELSAPTPNQKIINRSQFYLDLKPSASHTYYGTQFIDARNRMLVLASPGMDFASGLAAAPNNWPYANTSDHSFSFNLNTNTWDPPAYIARFPGGGNYTAALVVKHPETEDIYYSRSYSGGAWWRWKQARNSWEQLSSFGRVLWFAGAAIDPKRSRMLIVGSYGGNMPAEVRELNGKQIPVVFTGLGAKALQLGGYAGVIYDEMNDAFLVAYNNSEKQQISILRVHTETWQVDAPEISGVAPKARPNGIQNAVQYVPELGGIVIAHSYTENVMFMRTSNTPSASLPAPHLDSKNLDPATHNTQRALPAAAPVILPYQRSALAQPPSTHTRTAPRSAAAIAVGQVITSFSLTSPFSHSAAPFVLGQAFRQGDIPAAYTVSASIPHFQASIKSRWPDGSVQFAILAGATALQANTPLRVELRAAAPLSAPVLTEQDLSAKHPDVSLSFETSKSPKLSTLLGKKAHFNPQNNRFTAGKVMDWIQGQEMSSWIYAAPIEHDSALTAWLEVRLWKHGQIEILPWIENGFLNRAGITEKNGTARVQISGVQRFSMPLRVLHHTRTPLVSGTTFSYWVGSDPQLTIRHDTVYLQQTKLVPSYAAEISANNSIFSSLATSFTPFALANYPVAIGSSGYHPSIGLLPEWDVVYLASGGDPRALAAVTVNAYAAGRYAIHYRDEKTYRPLLFSSYPNLVLNGVNAGVSSSGTSTVHALTPKPGGASPPTWATSHAPSVGYLAYLLHGRFYFMEQTQFAATLVYLKQGDETRQFSKGLLLSNAGANTTRGAAWGLRTYLHAALASPDEDPLKSNFRHALDENIAFYHARYIAKANNPQGIVAPYSDYTAGDHVYRHAIWMEDFLTAAFGYLLDAKAYTPTLSQKAQEFFNWKARSIVDRLGPPGISAAYDFRDAAAYTIAIAPTDSANWETGAGLWYANWGEIYRATLGETAGTAAPNQLRGGYFPEATSYWGNLLPAIAYAVTLQVPGADAAYTRLTNAANWPAFLNNANQAPVWSIKPAARGN